MSIKVTTPSRIARTLTRDDWIASARKVLITAGIEDVKVDRLARKMHVTRGSFYWHFKDRDDLLQALLSDWEGRNFFEIAQIRSQWTGGGPRLDDVLATWYREDPAFTVFGMAIRVWAQKDPTVSASLDRVDNAWIALFQELFREIGYDPTQSFIRARVTYFHQVGYYALRIKEQVSDRVKLAPYYYEVLTGQAPPKDLVSRLGAIATAGSTGKHSRGSTSIGEKRDKKRKTKLSEDTGAKSDQYSAFK